MKRHSEDMRRRLFMYRDRRWKQPERYRWYSCVYYRGKRANRDDIFTLKIWWEYQADRAKDLIA